MVCSRLGVFNAYSDVSYAEYKGIGLFDDYLKRVSQVTMA